MTNTVTMMERVTKTMMNRRYSHERDDLGGRRMISSITRRKTVRETRTEVDKESAPCRRAEDQHGQEGQPQTRTMRKSV